MSANIVTNDDDGRERPAYTHYTEDDERNMVDWLAKHHPHKEGRENKRIWNQLYNDPATESWSKERLPSDWRDRYMKFKDAYDEAVERRIHCASPISQETKEAINHLAKYFAALDIAEDMRSQTRIYQTLKSRKREDWVTTRSASEWREFYQKHHKDIDTRAKQLGYIPLELATSTTANLTDAQDKRDIGQLAQAKQLKNIPNKLAASTSTTATLTDAQDKKDIEQLAQYFAQHKIKEDERRQATFFDKLPRKHNELKWVHARTPGAWRALYLDHEGAITKRVTELELSASTTQTGSKRQKDLDDRVETQPAKRRRIDASAHLDVPLQMPKQVSLASEEYRTNGSTRQNGTRSLGSEISGLERNRSAANGTSGGGEQSINGTAGHKSTTIAPATHSPKYTPSILRERTPEPPTPKGLASGILASALEAYRSHAPLFAATPEPSQVNGTQNYTQSKRNAQNVPHGAQGQKPLPIDIFPSSLPGLSNVLQPKGLAAELDREPAEFGDEVPSPMPNLGDDWNSSYSYSFSGTTQMHTLNSSAPPNSYQNPSQQGVPPDDTIRTDQTGPAPEVVVEEVAEKPNETTRPPRYLAARKRSRRLNDSSPFASGSSDKEEVPANAAANGIHRPVTQRTNALGVVRERAGRTSLNPPRGHSAKTPEKNGDHSTTQEARDLLGTEDNDVDKENVLQDKHPRTNVAKGPNGPKRNSASMSTIGLVPSSIMVTLADLADAGETTPLPALATNELDLTRKTHVPSKPVASLKNRAHPRPKNSSKLVRANGISNVSNPALVYPSPNVSPTTEEASIGREQPSPSLKAAEMSKALMQDQEELVLDSDVEVIETSLRNPSKPTSGTAHSDKSRHTTVRFDSVALERNQRRKTTGGIESVSGIENAQKQSVFSDKKPNQSSEDRAGQMVEDRSLTARLLQGPGPFDDGAVPHKSIHITNSVHPIKAQQSKIHGQSQTEIIDIEDDEEDEQSHGQYRLDDDNSPLARSSRAFSSPAKRTKQPGSGSRSIGKENNSIPPPPTGIFVQVRPSSSPLPSSSPIPPSTTTKTNKKSLLWPSPSARSHRPTNVSIQDMAVPKWSPLRFSEAPRSANLTNQKNPVNSYNRNTNNRDRINSAGNSGIRITSSPTVVGPPNARAVPSVLEFRDQVEDSEWIETTRGRPHVISHKIDPRRRSAPLPTPNDVEVYSSFSSPVRPDQSIRRYSAPRAKLRSSTQIDDEVDVVDETDDNQETQDDHHDREYNEEDTDYEEEPDVSSISLIDRFRILEFLRKEDPHIEWKEPSEVPSTFLWEGLVKIFEHRGDESGFGPHLPKTLWMKCGDLEKAQAIFLKMCETANQVGNNMLREENRKKIRADQDRRTKGFTKGLSRSHSRRTSLASSKSRSRRQSRHSGVSTTFANADEDPEEDSIFYASDESFQNRNSSRPPKDHTSTDHGVDVRGQLSEQSKSVQPPKFIPAELWDDLHG